MAAWLYSAINLAHNSAGIDDKCVPSRIFLSLEVRQTPILSYNFSGLVCQKLEIQSFFRAKLPMRIACVKTYAEHHRILRLILCSISLEIVGLNRAALGEVFGIEIQYHPFSPILLKRDWGSIL